MLRGVIQSAAPDSTLDLSAPRTRRGPPVRSTTVGALGAVGGGASTVAWWLSGRGGYWPVWVWIGTVAATGVIAVVEGAWRIQRARIRWNALHLGLGFVAALIVSFVWLRTGGGEWLGWTLLGIAVAGLTHTILAYSDRLPPRPRELRLSARVEQLDLSRVGALDAELVQLRRIERDLHDGAQSRLVALNVLLGRAQSRLADRPDAAALVDQARLEAVAAITELRSLARGMAPPFLDERGLGAALEALALRAPVNVRLSVELDHRPPRSVEAGAYFVISEALTNVAKHARTDQAWVTVESSGDRLIVTIEDDGEGGADKLGSGLVGMRQRVLALDGSLTIQPSGRGGTEVRAELPCGS
jgi:two-component sensor histidine kinase